MTITYTGIKNFLREVASIAGLVVGLGNQLHLPGATQAALVAVSGWLQVTSHKIDKAAAAAAANPTSSSGGAS